MNPEDLSKQYDFTGNILIGTSAPNFWAFTCNTSRLPPLPSWFSTDWCRTTINRFHDF